MSLISSHIKLIEGVAKAHPYTSAAFGNGAVQASNPLALRRLHPSTAAGALHYLAFFEKPLGGRHGELGNGDTTLPANVFMPAPLAVVFLTPETDRADTHVPPLMHAELLPLFGLFAVEAHASQRLLGLPDLLDPAQRGFSRRTCAWHERATHGDGGAGGGATFGRLLLRPAPRPLPLTFFGLSSWHFRQIALSPMFRHW
jgi:hypothetical protein